MTDDSPSSSNKMNPDLESQSPSPKPSQRNFSSILNEHVEHHNAAIPLAWQSFITGLVDLILYSRSQVWVGFQTGNMVQFSGNIAQFMLPDYQRHPLKTLMRILSIVAFFLGSFVSSVGGRYVGDRTRKWLFINSVLQSCLLWGAAGILLSRPEYEQPTFDYFPAVLTLAAWSLGMQAAASQKLTSPHFATTVAFTATITQIASDPNLFKLRSPTRDKRMVGIVCLCIGAGVGEMLLYADTNLRGAMAIVAGFKLIQAFMWFLPKASPPPQ
ncbi:hypothetical protein J056_000229 [Wallemia ichthyophaga EXF-994]|uniref:DUF1275 domain protein n=1 Tax=Wallemia ichthyophaga (strain EXF-994 / CBS 113033) TaxID=1299270 RepID=R9ARM4_WALI9|nr:uncharacterized protein J056_000229 [Wallemia ichthyophaga EXF-994]EOR04877.1 hypothetical protein J056_000229 [Wallemia ichthyophaga EXF-994]TIB37226.1 hypothetical protein E3P84_00352 [Wallemia ichthyophaga]TIB43763.1 hypothetical protein E3P83_00495 [Wallemia ichthyophaga]